MEAETVTRFLGKCPVCEGDFKLTSSKTLVHHGFQRPGDGMIHGDCFAVHKDPYEVSCETSKKYKAKIEQGLAIAQSYLAKLESGEVTSLLKEVSKGYGRNKVVELKTVTKESDSYDFGQLLHSAVWRTKGQISSAESEIRRMDRLITEWTPKPIRDIEERVEAERQAKAERAQAVADKRAAKVQAKVEGLQKRIDSAMRTKNASSIRTLWGTMTGNLALDLKITRTELRQLVNREATWELFGLKTLENGRSDDEANRGVLSKMDGYFLAKGVKKFWP